MGEANKQSIQLACLLGYRLRYNTTMPFHGMRKLVSGYEISLAPVTNIVWGLCC